MGIDKHRAFTVVELLIVLAVFAILLVISAPKMVESKLLSRLIQVSQDHRLIQTALDAYFVDHGGYPMDHYLATQYWPVPERAGFNQLTSPVRYLAHLMVDPFRIPTQIVPFPLYGGESGSDAWDCGGINTYQDLARRDWSSSSCIHAYMITSMGPDGKNSTSSRGAFPYQTSGTASLNSYSPTNGTQSQGDIYRFTGEYRRGFVMLDGVPLGYPRIISTNGGQKP